MGEGKMGLREKVFRYIEEYGMIEEGDVVAAGVSGGADSVCLLLLLEELRESFPFELLAVHVNHGLRGKAADADEEYVRRLCGERGIPFFGVKVQVDELARERGLSVEEAGRTARYEAFERVIRQYEGGSGEKNDKGHDGRRGRIAVAHNQNDRAETMLFNLFRGCGLAGACGIRPVRGRVVRPLLCADRGEIEEYLREKEIPFCIDASNQEDTYTRNKIRHHILPYAEEISRGAAAHMAEAAGILEEAEAYVRRRAGEACRRCVTAEEPAEGGRSGICLAVDLEAWRREDAFVRKYILLLCLERLTESRRDLTGAHMEALCSLTGKGGSASLDLPYGLKARKEYDRLFLEREAGRGIAEKTVPGPVEITIPGRTEVTGLGTVFCRLMDISGIQAISREKSQIIPEKTYTKWFDYDKITRSLVFRARQTGDYLTIGEGLSHKSVKEYMIDQKIPRRERDGLMLLADGKHILWIPGHRISQYYKIGEYTKRILEIRIGGEL